jgi:hypothetical protein
MNLSAFMAGEEHFSKQRCSSVCDMLLLSQQLAEHLNMSPFY